MPINLSSSEDLAWASGIFDGEGSSGTYIAKGKYNTIHIEISIGQGHPYLVYRFHEIIDGYGSISFSKKKNFYTLRIMQFEHVQYVMCLIWKKLGPIKRKQYIESVKFYLSNCFKLKFDKLSIYKREYDKFGSAAIRDKAMRNKIMFSNKPFINPFGVKNANIID